MKIFIAALLVSTAAFAQDYEIHRFEASDYRDWTFEEMSRTVGEASALLPHYACNGRDEFDPFWTPLRTNPAGDSLTVRNHTTKELYTYRQGTFADQNGNVVTGFDDPFMQYAV